MAIQIDGMFASPCAIMFETVLVEGDEYYVRKNNGQWRVYRYTGSSWKVLGIVVTRQQVLVLETLFAKSI